MVFEAKSWLSGRQSAAHEVLAGPISTSFFIGRLILCPSGQVINGFFSASKADFFSFNSRWIALRTTLDHRLANGRHILFLLSVGGHLGILIFLKCWTRDIVWRQKKEKKETTEGRLVFGRDFDKSAVGRPTIYKLL